MIAVHRVCVEFLPSEELARPEVVRLLARFRVAPMVAMGPGSDDRARVRALAPYLAAGLPACAWPLLDDGEGYWPSEGNAEAFRARVEALFAAAQQERLALPWIAVDLEPPVGEVAQARRGSLWSTATAMGGQAARHLDRDRFQAAGAAYAALQQWMAAQGARSVAISYPVVSADFAVGGEVMQDLCEAPLRCGWDAVAIMTYGSLIAGYSHGLLSVEDARWYGYRALARLSRALGARAGAFIGVVGPGKLGDEPAYDDPEELRRDADAARAAGVGELSLFGLEGVLAARDPEAWLRALTDGGAARPPFRARGELLHRSIEAAARAIGLLRRIG